MKKGSFHIFSSKREFVERLNSKPMYCHNNFAFELRYEAEEEIRMGCWVSELNIFFENENITDQFLNEKNAATLYGNHVVKKHNLVQLPDQYQPFSHTGLYAFIPYSIYREEPKLTLIHTKSLNSFSIDFHNRFKGNVFSPQNESVLLIGTDVLALLNCITKEFRKIQLPFVGEIKHVLWEETNTIRILAFSKAEALHKMLEYNIIDNSFCEWEIARPSEVFSFDYDEFMAVEAITNHWLFHKYDRHTKAYFFSACIPNKRDYNLSSIRHIYKRLRTIDVLYHFNGNYTEAVGNEVADIIAPAITKNKSSFLRRVFKCFYSKP